MEQLSYDQWLPRFFAQGTAPTCNWVASCQTASPLLTCDAWTSRVALDNHLPRSLSSRAQSSSGALTSVVFGGSLWAATWRLGSSPPSLQHTAWDTHRLLLTRCFFTQTTCKHTNSNWITKHSKAFNVWFCLIHIAETRISISANQLVYMLLFLSHELFFIWSQTGWMTERIFKEPTISLETTSITQLCLDGADDIHWWWWSIYQFLLLWIVW